MEGGGYLFKVSGGKGDPRFEQPPLTLPAEPRDAISDKYGRYYAILSRVVLKNLGPCTDRNRSVLLTLWSKHRSNSRVQNSKLNSI